jgi:hypothetical protein
VDIKQPSQTKETHTQNRIRLGSSVSKPPSHTPHPVQKTTTATLLQPTLTHTSAVNNKGVIDWCLFGRFAEEANKNISASSISQRCSSSCSKIRSSIDFDIKSDPGGYDFCAHNTNANFTADAAECADCLYQYEDLSVLGNVLSTVRDMCDKKPGRNYTIGEGVEVYGAERINLSDNATSASPSASPTPSSTPASSASSSDDGLSKGAIAGIVLGGLLALIALLGLALFALKRRKNSARRAEAIKGGELADTSATGSSGYHQAPAGKENFGYVAEADAGRAPPVELGDGGEGGGASYRRGGS